MNDVTHLGFQDIPMLSNIPNLVYLAPATKEEYLAMLDWSMEQTSYPVAIKLPGGPMISDGSRVTKDFGRLNRLFMSGWRGGVVIMNTMEVLTLLLVIFTALAYIDGHNKRK